MEDFQLLEDTYLYSVLSSEWLVTNRVPKIGFLGTQNHPKGKLNKVYYLFFVKFLAYLMIFVKFRSDFYALNFDKSSKNAKKSREKMEKSLAQQYL